MNRFRLRHHTQAKPLSNRRRSVRPAAFRRHLSRTRDDSQPFYAPEDWHDESSRRCTKYVVQPPGEGYVHPVSADEVRERLAELPERFSRLINVVQFSRMTRKRALFPHYGMQWGPNVYLYPIEESFVETYLRPPRPQQQVEAGMYGGVWSQEGKLWRLTWTAESIRDFYLNNVLIHEVGHLVDDRNTRTIDRERFAEWFAIEYGYRVSRGRRPAVKK